MKEVKTNQAFHSEIFLQILTRDTKFPLYTKHSHVYYIQINMMRDYTIYITHKLRESNSLLVFLVEPDA